MQPLKIAHVSDLHVGRDQWVDWALGRLTRSLAASKADWICCTGDITHNGLSIEARRFAQFFAPLKTRLTVVPGNHDRQGDDVATVLRRSRGPLWQRTVLDGRLKLICLDSTQPVNATGFAAHGEVEPRVVDQTIRLTAEREEDQSILVLVHHHLVRAAPDDALELFSDMRGLPFAGCLKHGSVLAQGLAGRVAAVLHGHKHRAAVTHVEGMPIVNAGCTTGLGRYRMLDVLDNAIIGEKWVLF